MNCLKLAMAPRSTRPGDCRPFASQLRAGQREDVGNSASAVNQGDHGVIERTDLDRAEGTGCIERELLAVIIA